MRKIMYYVHQSLDGFIAGPNGEFDWAVLGPELSDYSLSLAERADSGSRRRPAGVPPGQ